MSLQRASPAPAKYSAAKRQLAAVLKKKNKRSIATAAATDVEDLPPVSWVTQYELIRKWRETHQAPVDTVGCERLADESASPATQRYQTLVALILSSQTKDEVTATVMRRLIDTGKFTAAEISNVEEKDLVELLRGVSFHRTKARFLRETSRALENDYDGDIPDTIEKLVTLPGVGKKVGYLALQCAWKKNDGIGVDVHVERISNRLGWVKEKNPDATRVALESLLPKNLWPEVNAMLVGFGQTLCTAVRPNCAECPVGKHCPSFSVTPVRKKSRVKA